MKILVLVRHAKSSWDHPGLSDFERPLNERGKADAPVMARRLKEKNIRPDLLVSSPAKRAKKTAKYFAEEFGVNKDDIHLVDELYLATPQAFTDAIASLDDKTGTAVLFAHNPGITEFACSLTNAKIDDMPTCALFAVQSDATSWDQFMATEKQFLFFDYPKNKES